MPTEILAVGTDAADSADVVVADGEELTVSLKDTGGPYVVARVDILLKDDDGLYFNVAQLSHRQPALVLTAGTWRFSRLAGRSCGVFSG